MTSMSPVEVYESLLEASASGDSEGISRALSLGADASMERSKALSLAAASGSLECVELLIKVSDPLDNASSPLRAAAEKGHLEIVRRLLDVCDAKAMTSAGLWSAAKEGHADVVTELLPHSNPKDGHSLALRWAAENGHLECVKILIPYSDVADVKMILNASSFTGSQIIDAVVESEFLKSSHVKGTPVRDRRNI